MLLYIISYHLNVICFSGQIVWHRHMCMCVYVHISAHVNLLWQGTFPCYNKEHKLDLNLKSNYYSYAFIIGLAGNRLQSVSMCFAATPNYFHVKIQLLSCEHTGEHFLLGRVCPRPVQAFISHWNLDHTASVDFHFSWTSCRCPSGGHLIPGIPSECGTFLD